MSLKNQSFHVLGGNYLSVKYKVNVCRNLSLGLNVKSLKDTIKSSQSLAQNCHKVGFTIGEKIRLVKL